MSAFDQVIVILKLACFVGPVAVYFVTLGLVNSQATPRMLTARGDFLALSVALLPILLSPIPWLVANGWAWLIPLAGLAAVAAWRRLLPPPDSGWVIYNLPAGQAQPLIERAIRALGWRYASRPRAIELRERGLRVTFSHVPLLRNATVHLRWDARAARRETMELIGHQLTTLIGRQQQLPSLSGCCLLLAGTLLLMFPLWMMSRHGQAIAEVVNQLFLM